MVQTIFGCHRSRHRSPTHQAAAQGLHQGKRTGLASSLRLMPPACWKAVGGDELDRLDHRLRSATSDSSLVPFPNQASAIWYGAPHSRTPFGNLLYEF